MVVGGSAAPEALIRALDPFGVRVIQGWGMTETSPVGLVNFRKRDVTVADEDAAYALRAKQGVPLPFFEVRAVAQGREVPWDGHTMGELEVRGPWVAERYHDMPDAAEQWSADGWFRTGDIATIDATGYVKITDRIKDLVKSGGEWISSIDLENALLCTRWSRRPRSSPFRIRNGVNGRLRSSSRSLKRHRRRKRSPRISHRVSHRSRGRTPTCS